MKPCQLLSVTCATRGNKHVLSVPLRVVQRLNDRGKLVFNGKIEAIFFFHLLSCSGNNSHSHFISAGLDRNIC